MKSLLVAGMIILSAGPIVNSDKRPGAGIPGKEMAGPNSPEYDGRSDFGRIFQYDVNAIHYYMLEIQNGNIEKVGEYSDAAKCWDDTFVGPKEGPWRVCVPLDEPAEEFLAQTILSAYGR
jgi:hypothetical protein